MNEHVTRNGVAVGTIDAIPKAEDERTRLRSEFEFTATLAHGRSWVFRYQMDARGAWLWHMYESGKGADHPADRPETRESLGVLAPNFTDDDIDRLIRRVSDIPAVTVYGLFPGHKDAINRPDFIFIPLTKKVISLLRIFMGVSDTAFRSDILYGMTQTVMDAHLFQLDGKQKELFFRHPESELGRIGEALRTRGFYMYIQGSPEDRLANLPDFIRRPVSTASIPRTWLKLERTARNPEGGQLLDKQNLPVGIIKEIAPIFSVYAEMVGQQQRLDAMNEEREDVGEPEGRPSRSLGQRFHDRHYPD